MRFLLFLALTATAQTPPVEYTRAGNPEDITTKTQPGYLLMGGGKDVEEAFRWLIERSGGGDFLVLRAGGTPAYNPFVQKLGTVNSAATMILRTREASSDPAVLDRINKAEAIFLAGGDQWNYIRFWKDTPMARALQRRIDQGVPIGGTSAGLAVLGEHYFSAAHDTITSEQALQNPFDERLAVGSGFLNIPALKSIITDSHFTPRKRIGRLIAFLTRLDKDARGIGIDEATALLVEPDGSAKVVGRNSVWFLNRTRPATTCEPGKPLAIENVRVFQLNPNQVFDLKRWTTPDATPSQLSVTNGTLAPAAP